MKILDLFAGKQSVLKALKENNMGEVDYVGIDIYSPEDNSVRNNILDLSSDNIVDKLVDILPVGWTPDFIWASPLCIPFSRAACIANGSLCTELINGKLVPRVNFKDITHKAYVDHKDDPAWQKKYHDKGVLGIKLFENTIKIINHFNVPFAIENPSNATSKYLMQDYIKNETHYCAYGFKYKKATAIYSDKLLNLKKCTHKNHEQVMSGWKNKTGIDNAPTSNADRSLVPNSLIIDIIEQSVNKGGK